VDPADTVARGIHIVKFAANTLKRITCKPSNSAVVLFTCIEQTFQGQKFSAKFFREEINAESAYTLVMWVKLPTFYTPVHFKLCC